MPTPPSPITVPNSLVYRSVAGRTLPLSNLEVDRNFAYVENLAEQRLLVSDFSSLKIIEKLNSDALSASVGGINSNLLRGFAPSTSSSSNTLVLRDSLGNFNANVITANTFNGNASTSTLATSAVKLNTPRNINGVSFDGTANITIADATKLAKSGDSMIGKLTTAASTTSAASLRIVPGVQPSAPVDGDVWSTSDSLQISLGGVTRQLAFTTSNISGYAANVSGIVPLTNGGTGAINSDNARINLSAAKSGVNSDITQLSGLTTPLNVSQGGTGLSAPGAVGNVLKSDGVKWVSQPQTVDPIFVTYGNYLPVTNYNSIGGYSTTKNYYDVFPPAGYTMNDFLGVAVSPSAIYFNGIVNAEDTLMCSWEKFSDRIRIIASNTKQRSAPRINYLAIWRKA